tara:strand:+ start:129 stop:380 length:252 start_codon:yes stop_codon:yes gene_type:complete
MRFPLIQLYAFNRSKPLVQVDDSDEWVQWDTCDLEGLPPERVNVSMTNMGKLSQGQYDNLPEMFKDINGTEYRIEDIHTMKSS